ncbi:MULTISPECIES: DUF6233 domain-containing protein [unclassified Streptomyces]|uniref:DUF6233 domain-containing protein n=1 Tax=unclassified Streptomyces TaxID=2593676 RepID=UPI00081E281E|nr:MULTISPECIES: DUF6233 domain-containing protein [unclassified Streptomyces]MYZ36481.1 hypothetical protein [Streptomyces sp. SID4917]SCF83880.1 hypothetical protein GA0115259_103425 [Streptomyces sp. MnatMP-M17]
MTEPGPRVTVTLPGGGTTEGRLHGRRRDADGRWWYEVSIAVPAAAARPIDGEDYTAVPTALDDADGWILQARPATKVLLLHRADCWATAGRLTPATTDQAADFIKHGWAEACDVCNPDP